MALFGSMVPQAHDNQGLVLPSAIVHQNLPESLAGEQGFEP